MADVTIYHNPKCSTSRTVLGLIRDAGIEPQIIEYLKTPPTRERLLALIAEMGITPRRLLRTKEKLAAELGLNDPSVSDEQIIDAMMAHPILIERPIVVGPRGATLARPTEAVHDVLPA
jgi:arsenate reductase